MQVPGSFASLARAVIPLQCRRLLRRIAHEAPQRLRDLPADLASLALPRAFGPQLPPPSLRSRVGHSSRTDFVEIGREGARQILEAFGRTRAADRRYPEWLDFGCGCGRIARHVVDGAEIRTLYGLDVDPALIAWAARNLRGRFATMEPEPPLPFQAESVDVVYAVSIFTHYTEAEQFRWLDELTRILEPGGLLIATTISPSQGGGFRGISDADFARLASRGFLCVNRDSEAFNERTAFHSPEYLKAEWSRRLVPRLYEPFAFVKYQDLSVWEKPPA